MLLEFRYHIQQLKTKINNMDPSGICVYGNDVIFNVNDDNYDIFTTFYDEISTLFNNKITPYDAWDLCDRGIVNIPNGYDWH